MSIILPIITFLIITIVCCFATKILFDEMEMGIGVAFVIFISLVIIFNFTAKTNEAIIEEVEFNICGLQDKVETEISGKGLFILGIGYASNNEETINQYYFYKENEYGKKLQNEDSRYIYIRETNEQTPCLLQVKKINKLINPKTFLQKCFIVIDGIPFNWGEVLVVPENTIKVEYNIDLK